MYVGDPVLCYESQENLMLGIGCFVEICKRRGVKVVVLEGEERSMCIAKVLNESSKGGAECCYMKAPSGKKVPDASRL